MNPFDTQAAQAINQARLTHLQSLDLLKPGMTVADVGAGVGHLASALVSWGCEVTAFEGRELNVEEGQRLYPGIDFVLHNIETKPLYTSFDAILCYGLLYHSSSPIDVLRNIALFADLLLIETVVTDTEKAMVEYVREPLSRDQALWGVGCRPSVPWVFQTLERMSFVVEVPDPQPNHGDFAWSPLNDGQWKRNGSHLRRVFVAKRG